MSMCVFFRMLLTALWQAIGAIGLVLGIVSAICPCCISHYWYLFLIGACLICLAWCLIKLLPRKEIDIKINDDLNVQIKQKDILLSDIERGIVIIPVNNYFDTQVDNLVVSSRKLHGKFVKYFQEHYKNIDLEAAIQKALEADGIKSSGRHNGNRKHLAEGTKLDQYPLGTVIRIKVSDDKFFFLVVASEFDEENHVVPQLENNPIMLINLFKKINQWNNDLPVYLPLIKGAQMGQGNSLQDHLEVLLKCLSIVHPYVTEGGTTICITKDVTKEIKLNQIKYKIEH